MILLISPSLALAGSLLDDALWKSYVLEPDDWIYKIVRQSPIVQSGKLKTEQVVKLVLSRNPQIINPNKVQPGLNILLPLFIIPQKKNKDSEGSVTYNFYYNSTVYNGSNSPLPPTSLPTTTTPETQLPAMSKAAVDAQPVEESVDQKIKNHPRKIAEAQTLAPVQVTSTKKTTPSTWEYEISLGSYYSLLKATTLTTQSQANQASNLNYQLEFNVGHNLYNDVRMNYLGALRNESYAIKNSVLYDLGIEVEYPISTNFSLKSGILYGQTTIISPENTTLTLANLSIPQVQLAVSYGFLRWLKTDFEIRVQGRYLFSGSRGNIKLQSGLSTDIELRVAKHFWEIPFAIKPRWSKVQLDTNLTKQNSDSLGVLLEMGSSF